NAPAPAASHAVRRRGCSSAPSAATESQPMLCSPKCERARAPASTPGRSASADCTATRAASSPRGAHARTAGPTLEGQGREVSAIDRRVQKDRLPLLLARERRQGLPVYLAHAV